MKILTRDDTEHDVEYVTRADAEREIEAWKEKAEHWKSLCTLYADENQTRRMSALDDGINPEQPENEACGAAHCSPCCGANVQVAGDYFEGTRWYQCTLCLKNCDPIQVRQLGRVWAARRGYNTALGRTKMHAIRGILDQAND